jgi:hypothetical protein
MLGLEAQNQDERLVNGSHLTRIEAAGGLPESLWIDHRRLLDQDPCFSIIDSDRGPEARGQRALRDRCDERCAQAEKLLGLNDDGVAGPTLFVPSRAARSRQTEHFPADHLNP